MSASLVGSEMCIRDSSWACLPLPLGGVRFRAVSQGQLPSTESHSLGLRCLLYTSDAADDM
eukprot:11942696-Alexandrium_andersonii.AAC.1